MRYMTTKIETETAASANISKQSASAVRKAIMERLRDEDGDYSKDSPSLKELPKVVD